MACVKAMVWRDIFLDQFKDGHKRDMGSFLRTHVYSEEEAVHKVDKPIYKLLKNKVNF